MSGAREHPGNCARLEPYTYTPSVDPPQSCTSLDLSRVDATGRPIASAACPPVAGPEPREDFKQRLTDEAQRSFAAGRERGIEEGRGAERAAHAPLEKHRGEQLRRLLEDFAGERDRYLHAVEHEVVRLALAITARILRREAQMDPLLLMGAVRVALGQLASATEVRLHVPAADADLWKESIALLPNPPVRPAVVAEADLDLGECRLEASLGQADLS
ncbi:MAG: FliH/SctL family protein, partial [Terracidiphilus sp.]